MSKLATALGLIKKNRREFLVSLLRNVGFLFPDEIYLKLLFRCKMGYALNLDEPETFCEKIQWLKLYNRKELYTTIVDKSAVKKWVAEKIGEDYIIPTLGEWNNANEIVFDDLPNRFVLKTTNGGGGSVVICKNKNDLNKKNTIGYLNRLLKSNIYKNYREWPYKNIAPKIIAEKYMEDKSGELNDYKFFCFDGRVKYCQVIRGRFSHETIDFYDIEWNHMPFVGLNPVVKNGVNPVEKPKLLKKMLDIASILSENIPFARVDLYLINEKVYFGEVTFYPGSGFGKFTPKEWDYKLGEELHLPLKTCV